MSRSTDAARQMADAASNTKLIEMLRLYAYDLEQEGRDHAPQWIREAANRLQLAINNGKVRADAKI
jgi:hypothetical protein